MIPGIDVSHWQKEIDWKEVRRSGVQFAFIKATEFPDRKTSLFRDGKLKFNIRGAEENNILWGAYHFFRTHIDGVSQAQAFCETVGSFRSLPPVIDLEAAGTKGERLNHKVKQFLDEVAQSMKEDKPFDNKAFQKRLRAWMADWSDRHETYPNQPIGDSVQVARKLWTKYGQQLDN